ncbi:cysteine synthase A [Gleimia coleocanis DSM 15436]|uniref:Cysteine synthase n=1 Tax=Gleimia coleocanis DSM 15436 TaxID=525245 RepID=C0W1B1_9ACTO|nr:cysteine synthase A [Gleimia coleocanis]EEH63600.1 cysteine synthase A [Gleimia coleocanis DSM 15436]
MANIANNITETIGHTPLVRINRVTSQQATVLAKVESFNPASSVKDRIAVAIVDAAEASGLLPAGGTLVEATSGNTGVALAMVGAARGYKVVISMPSSMSVERRLLMRAFGAELILTDPKLGMAGAVAAAEELVASREGAVLASQFKNPANPATHVANTGEEIWNDTDGQVDILVAGVGTGGTISGTAATLKAKNPSLQVVALEPADSPLLTEGTAGPHGIQGIGANFVPDNLNREILDEIIPVPTDGAMEFARRAAAEEGLLVGISAGAALWGANQVASRPENEGKTIVVILPDTGERYLSTALWQHLAD